MSTPAESFRAKLRAQHPDRHAPVECPCRDGHTATAYEEYLPEHGTRGVRIKCARCGQLPASPRRCPRCDDRLAPDAPLPPEVLAAVDAAVAREREACAGVADACAKAGMDNDNPTAAGHADAIAAAIRARGKETP